MKFSPGARRMLAGVTLLILVVIYAPLVMVLINSFNTSPSLSWPPDGYTTKWWSAAAQAQSVRDALWVSIKVALLATGVALVLGTMAAMALHRFKFFGRDFVSLLIILPIALPGVVTGVALANAFLSIFGLKLGFVTLVIGHATFCIVTVFNNAMARLRRMGTSLEEASADLGAGPFKTFFLVTLPGLRSALLAGALLSFALSFDEIIVTTFTAGAAVQTLPIWITNNLFRPNLTPVVNVVAACLILFSIVPIWLAQRLAGGDELTSSR